MPDASAPTPAAPSKLKIFLRRLSSTVVLWTFVLVGLFYKDKSVADFVFLVMMMLLAASGLVEFYGLAEKRDLKCFKRWGIMGGMLLMAGTFLHLTGHLGTQ